MRKPLTVSLLALAAAAAWAQESYVGLFQAGNRIGYSRFVQSKSTMNGKPVSRTDSKTVMKLGMLGSPLSILMDSSSWSDSHGHPLKMTFRMSSAGRANDVVATFGDHAVRLVIDDSGAKSVRTIPLPKGERIVDDPMTMMIGSKFATGSQKAFYVLDFTTATFIKNTLTIKGKSHTTVNGKPVDATLVEVVDPRATTKVYVDRHGNLVKVEAPLGIDMIPISKAVALGEPDRGYTPSSDLAVSTSIPIDKPLPALLHELKIRVTGHDLSALVSDAHQTVSKSGASWVVDVHPPALADRAGGTIAASARQMPQWLKPDIHVPSDSPAFARLARKIVGTTKDVKPAALAIKRYVYNTMRPNAGIGVLRDASEVLRTKEGVCRDYAILTTTLLRAGHIPARLASGIVNFDGKFYYHAWAEAWDGSRWLGIDSTVPSEQISAGHVKLGCGSVGDAFTFGFLGSVKVEVLQVNDRR